MARFRRLFKKPPIRRLILLKRSPSWSLGQRLGGGQWFVGGGGRLIQKVLRATSARIIEPTLNQVVVTFNVAVSATSNLINGVTIVDDSDASIFAGTAVLAGDGLSVTYDLTRDVTADDCNVRWAYDAGAGNYTPVDTEYDDLVSATLNVNNPICVPPQPGLGWTMESGDCWNTEVGPCWELEQ